MHEKNKIGVIAHDFIGAVRGIDRFTDYGINPTLVIDEKVSEECDVIAINTNSKITSPKNA
jgi:uncharacterized protein YgbK (DUF1537 family)